MLCLKIFKQGIAALLVLFSLTHSASRNAFPDVLTMVDLTTVPHMALRFASIPQEGIVGLNVPTIAPYSEDLFFIANFETIALLDTQQGLIRPFQVTASSQREVRQSGYQPTGLFYDPHRNYLFVANYLRNNVMVFRVLYKERQLQLVHLLKHASLVSPESLWLDQASGVLVTANFDGHSVSAFQMNADLSFRFLWKTPLRFAHGLAVAEGKVFATGLQERVLVELDLKTGQRMRKTGRLGWHTQEGQFLWPTSVYPDGAGNLIVSDAETGFISVIDIATLSVRRVVGGNGPGRAFFNQPYSTAVINDRFLTISTKQQRFVYGEYPALRPTKAFTRSEDFWKYFSPTDPEFRLGHGGWNDYWWIGGPRVRLMACEYRIYSNTLRPDAPSESISNIMQGGGARSCPDIRLGYVETPFGMNMFKQVQMVERGGWYIFLSPQSHSGPLFVKLMNGMLYAVYHSDGQNDCWVVSDAIYCSNGMRDLEVMLKQVNEFVASLERKRCKSGMMLHKDYVETLSWWYRRIGADERYLAHIDASSLVREAYLSKKGAPTRGEDHREDLGRFYSAWERTKACDDIPGVARVQAAAKGITPDFFKVATVTQLSISSLVLRDPISETAVGWAS
jgi:hypothetical protein